MDQWIGKSEIWYLQQVNVIQQYMISLISMTKHLEILISRASYCILREENSKLLVKFPTSISVFHKYRNNWYLFHLKIAGSYEHIGKGCTAYACRRKCVEASLCDWILDCCIW